MYKRQIRGHVALLEPLAIGLSVTAFVFIETEAGCMLDEVLDHIVKLPGVVEVHRLMGEWCFPVSYTHLDVYKRQIQCSQHTTTKGYTANHQEHRDSIDCQGWLGSAAAETIKSH